jgi:hypothetical protein
MLMKTHTAKPFTASLTMKKITMNLSSYECGCYEKIQVMKISSYEMNVSKKNIP